MKKELAQDVVERFLRYVQIDTQSSDEPGLGHPSTAGQWDLLRLLQSELEELGLAEINLSEGGVLTALLPASVEAAPGTPMISYLAHVDTYHGTSGKDVKPNLIEDYDGQDIILPGSGEVLSVSDNPELKNYQGQTIITADGNTVLGADDKAGVAEIMTCLKMLMSEPDIIHGPIKVAFTPDEEIGQGTATFPSLEDFGAHVAYTVDGGPEGEVENETFCADTAIVKLIGLDVHPGYAKGKMVNAIRAASYLVGLLPGDALPETTEGMEGYLHPLQIKGDVNGVTIPFLVRDFELENLALWERKLEGMLDETVKAFPGLRYELTIEHSYKNMRYYLDKEPRAVEKALEAVRRVGLTPDLQAIRGGTDGSRLSEMGLPTPNLFAGGRNFHSVREWIPVNALEKAVEVLAELARLWAEPE